MFESLRVCVRVSTCSFLSKYVCDLFHLKYSEEVFQKKNMKKEFYSAKYVKKFM